MKSSDPARAPGPQSLLRVVHAHELELRARRSGFRQTPCRSRPPASSVDKGESLKDTAITLGVRPGRDRDPPRRDRRAAARRALDGRARRERRRRKAPASGRKALLDLYTLHEEFGRVDGLHVAIVGDVLHSRVARSNIQALTMMGARVTLVGPPSLIPRGIEALGCEATIDIDAIKAADVVYVLRMQRERMLEGATTSRAARVRGALGRDLRPPAPGQKDAPRPDEPRGRDRPGRRRCCRRVD